MNRKLSPTPWTIKGNAVFDANGEVIADIYGEQAEQTANGYLITAAPELLDWAKDLVAQLEKPSLYVNALGPDATDSLRLLKKAIAKAEGK